MERTALQADAKTAERPPPSFRQKLAFKLGIGVWRSDQQFEGYLFLIPSLIGFTIFVLLPILISLVLSFHSWDLLTPPKFIGTANYIELFTNDPIFGDALKNTFWYALIIVPAQITVGFLLGLALTRGLRAMKLYRLLYFMPVVASIVAAAIVFRFLFNSQNGIIAAEIYQIKGFLMHLPFVASSPDLLAQVSAIKPPDFLNGGSDSIWPGWALVSVAIFTVWKNVGFTMVVYMAALQAVPDVLTDAAKVDGANRWQVLRYITIPLVSPTTFFLVVTILLGAFRIFTEPFIISANTQGQIPTASASLVTYIYQNAFDFQRMGKASAISWVLFAIVFVVTIIQTVLQRRWVYYETE